MNIEGYDWYILVVLLLLLSLCIWPAVVQDEILCKICMDASVDCVFLECGHMVTCVQCGKQMNECPICRQYVVRVVRTFRI